MLTKIKTSRILAFFMLAVLLAAVLPFPAAIAAGDYEAKFGAFLNEDADDGGWPDLSASNITFSEGEEATISVSFDSPRSFHGEYAAIETSFPATGFGKVTSFKLDGNEVEIGAVYLNNEGIDGGLRLTLCNTWNSDIAVQPVDLASLGEFSQLEITFVVTETASYKAEFGAQFDPNVNADVGEWPDSSGWTTDFAPGEEATISIDFGAPVAFGGNYAAINTDFPYPGSAGQITSFKLDGNEVEMGDAFINGEPNGDTLRLTICNKWNGDITEQPVDVATLGEFSKIEISFIVEPTDEVQQPVEETPASDIPEFDPNGTYHVYMGLQSENYIFRNAWSDKDYGAEGASWANYNIGNNFNGLTGWDGSDAVIKDGVFTDAEIKGNGTYQVTLTDFDFGNDEFLRLLFLSSDIPVSGGLTFTDVKVKMNDSTKYTFDTGVVNEENTSYYEIQCINQYNEDLGGEEGLFGYAMPTNSIVLEFTVSGLAYDKAEDAPAETDASPAPGENSPPEDTAGEDTSNEGGFPWWGILLIIAGVVAAAAAIFAFIKKNSKKA